LACQRSVVYLREQLLYEGQVTRDGQGNYSVGADFAPWANLLDFLVAEKRKRKIGETEPEEVIGWKWVDVMTETTREVPPPQHPDLDLESGHARVQFYNDCNAHGGMGWTVARNTEGELVQAKVHWSSIRDQEGFATLHNGALVSFERLEMASHMSGPDKGLKRGELRGVRLVEEAA